MPPGRATQRTTRGAPGESLATSRANVQTRRTRSPDRAGGRGGIQASPTRAKAPVLATRARADRRAETRSTAASRSTVKQLALHEDDLPNSFASPLAATTLP